MRRRQIPVSLTIFAITMLLLMGTRAAAQTDTVLHSFDNNGEDGYAPNAGLISDAAGNLYGTTPTGGTGSCMPEYGSIPTPCGTVFELSPQSGGGWTEKVLYSFHGADGYNPAAGLTLDATGNLYGMTTWGGTGLCVPFKQSNPMGCGVVFELTPAAGGVWSEKVLHDFKVDGSGGTGPSAGLVFDAAGNLYGTTKVGGAYGYGTVFELSPASGGNWNEAVLYSFNYENGSSPNSILVFLGGNLYGTTANGGRPHGGGTVFELTPKTGGGWSEKVLHSFCSQVNCRDGYYPAGNLIVDAAGNLYGTTLYGGNHVSCEQGTTYICGTAFELTLNADRSWTETVLHDFGAHGDGAYPSGGLVFDAAGNLYGTTFQGGTDGSGTVFEMSPQADGNWAESVLYSFHTGKMNDGGFPVGSLVIDASGSLYGATGTGGMYYDGTVFEIKR
jgi:uncharacterized repeat protein (TIGR03803 family)